MGNILKRVTAAAFCAVLALTLAPIVPGNTEKAWASEGDVTVSFDGMSISCRSVVHAVETLKLYDATQATITLNHDVDIDYGNARIDGLVETVAIPAGSDCTLDLNGYRLRIGDRIGRQNLCIGVDGTSAATHLTIKDSSQYKSGRILVWSENYRPAVYVTGKQASFTLESGTIQTLSWDGSAIEQHNLASMDIKGGNVNSPIFANSYGNLSISGGNFSKTIKVYDPRSVSITGGKFSGEVSISEPESVSISGGQFSAAVNISSPKKASISGGTLPNKLDNNYLASGCQWVPFKNGSGNVDRYGVASVQSWGAALRVDEYTKQDGTYITDKADIRFGFGFTVPDGATIERISYAYRYKGGTKSGVKEGPAFQVYGPDTVVPEGDVRYRAADQQKFPVDKSDTGYVGNLIIRGIPAKAFEDVCTVRVTITYSLNGSTGTITSDEKSGSVASVAKGVRSIAGKDTASYRYVDALLTANGYKA